MNTYRSSCIFFTIGSILVLSGCYPASDYNIAYFEPGEAKVLEGKQLYFAAGIDPYEAPYVRTVSDQEALPVDPTDHTPVDFVQADPFEIRIGNGFLPNRVYVASDGTISLDYPNSGNATLREHFSDNKISLLPMDAQTIGAEVRYDVSDDGLVITYLNAGGNTVQFHYLPEEQPTGDRVALRDIAITYETVSDAVSPGVVGLPLSSFFFGGFAPFDPDDFLLRFQESDLCEDSFR